MTTILTMVTSSRPASNARVKNASKPRLDAVHDALLPSAARRRAHGATHGHGSRRLPRPGGHRPLADAAEEDTGSAGLSCRPSRTAAHAREADLAALGRRRRH